MNTEKITLTLNYKSLDGKTAEPVVINETLEIGRVTYRGLVRRFAVRMLGAISQAFDSVEWWQLERVAQSVKVGHSLIAFREFTKSIDSMGFTVVNVSDSGYTEAQKCLVVNAVNDAILMLVGELKFSPDWNCKFWFADGALYVSLPILYAELISESYGKHDEEE